MELIMEYEGKEIFIVIDDEGEIVITDVIPCT